MKPDSHIFSGTNGDILSTIEMLKVTKPQKLSEKWIEITNIKAKERNANRQTFINIDNQLVVDFDKGIKNENGFKAHDHYHVRNPKRTGKLDYYLDINGNPCAKKSKASHIIIRKGE